MHSYFSTYLPMSAVIHNENKEMDRLLSKACWKRIIQGLIYDNFDDVCQTKFRFLSNNFVLCKSCLRYFKGNTPNCYALSLESSLLHRNSFKILPIRTKKAIQEAKYYLSHVVFEHIYILMQCHYNVCCSTFI